MVVVEARVMDATHLELTRPIDTPPGEKVIVSLLDPAREDSERDAWLKPNSKKLNNYFLLWAIYSNRVQKLLEERKFINLDS